MSKLKPKLVTKSKDGLTLSPPELSAIGQQATNRKASLHKAVSVKFTDEHLGEDFEDTPWVPPRVDLARENRSKLAFRNGNAKLSKVKVIDAHDCGSGLPLYFIFVQSMCVAFFIMSILSIPAMLLTYHGSKMAITDRDPLGLYKLSLGNLGYNAVDEEFYPCTTGGYGVTKNSTCIDFYGTQLTTEQAGVVITAFEFLQVIVFLMTLFFLRIKSDLIAKQSEAKDCVVSDYAIMVTGIPKDTTITQIITHFTNLYQLKETDWRNRPPLANAEVVTNISNILSPDASIHMNTWIAEATIFRKYGMFIRSFREEEDLMTNLIRARAFMKMYKADTPHMGGYNQEKYKKWEHKWGMYTAEIDRLTTHLIRRNASTSKGKSGTVKESQSKGKVMGLSDIVDADAVAAFVVFQYSESMARCVEDYQAYSRFPWSLCYPSRMKFRGTRINVRKAPEPDEIIWENLEVPTRTKYWRRFRTTFVTLLFLIAGFMFIIQAAVEKNSFKKELPVDYLCKTELPALYLGTYKGTSDTSLQRPAVAADASGNTRAKYDTSCKAVIPGSFYIIAVNDDDPAKPVGHYSTSACSKKSISQPVHTYGQCPHFNQTVFCPCHTTSSSETCPSTLACDTEINSGRCDSFNAGLIGGCYCYSQMLLKLQGLLSLSGLGSGLALDSSDPCYNFYQSFSTAIGLTYGAAFATVITNMILRWIIFRSAKSEYYNSFDRENGSVIQKLFIVLYLNMGIVCLFAFGYYVNSPSDFAKTGILQGSFVDFTGAWYGQVGEFLIITFAANALSPLASDLLYYLIIMPYSRWSELKKVENLSSTKYAMQADLNKLFIGPTFTSTDHSAHLLSLLFLTMTYAPSLPILNILLCMTLFVFFNLDKRLLLRYYQRPAYMSDGMFQIILRTLPYAAVLRLCMACWMFGNNEVVPSVATNVGFIPAYSSANPADAQQLYQNYLSSHSNDHSLQFMFVSKVVRLNVFPLFILLLVIITSKVISWVLQYIPLGWIWEHLGLLYRKLCRPKHVHAVSKIKRTDGFLYGQDMMGLKDRLRQEIAPYTGPYYKFVRYAEEESTRFKRCLKSLNLAADDITKDEAERGWQLLDIEDFVAKVKKYRDRDLYTYEIIRERSCSSYAIERIPAYATAMHGLTEGLTNLDPEMQSGVISPTTSLGRAGKKPKSSETFNISKSASNDYDPTGESDYDPSLSKGSPSRTPNVHTANTSTSLSESGGTRLRYSNDQDGNAHKPYFPGGSKGKTKDRYDDYDEDEDEDVDNYASRSSGRKKKKKGKSNTKGKGKKGKQPAFDSVDDFADEEDESDDNYDDDDNNYGTYDSDDDSEADADLVHPQAVSKKKPAPASKTAKVSPQKSSSRKDKSKSKKKQRRVSHDAAIPDDWRTGEGGLM